jgi:hypothetical protein
LAKKGYSLWIVARPGKHQTARGRVEQLFDWLEAGPWDLSKIRIIEGYLDQRIIKEMCKKEGVREGEMRVGGQRRRVARVRAKIACF